jgi:hypothetical protein
MARGRIAALGILLLGSAFCARPLYGQAESHYVCLTTKGIPKSRVGVLYITPVTAVSGTVADLRAAWEKYAVSNIDPNSGPGIASCFIGSESNVSVSRDSKIAVWQGSTITNVNWKYSPSMTAMPSKPGAVYSFCNSGTFVSDKTVYETGVFEIPREDAMSTNSPVEVTFASYLIKQKRSGYPLSQWYSKSVACPHTFETREQAQTQHDKAAAAFRSSGMSVVATNWVYARNADTPAANPRPSDRH